VLRLFYQVYLDLDFIYLLLHGFISLTHDLSVDIFNLLGPESAELKIRAVVAFAKALIDVTTEVDEDEDPQDAIKEYGKEVARSLATFGIAEASKVAKMAKKAWKSQKVKAKALPSFKVYPRRYREYHPAVPPHGAAPAAVNQPTQPRPAYVSQVCPVCGRLGHTEPTCYQAHPELRPVRTLH
jgi:hypothetical protein